MRLFIAIAMLVFTAGAQAADTVYAADYTCSQLKSLVRSTGALTIIDRLGPVTVYPNAVACFEQGIMHTKYETVRAKDKRCVVGLSCDIYFGGM